MQRRVHASRGASAVQSVQKAGALQVHPLEKHLAGFPFSLAKCGGTPPRGGRSPSRAIAAWEDPRTPPRHHLTALPGGTPNASLGRARAVVPTGMVQQGQQLEVLGCFMQNPLASDLPRLPRYNLQRNCIMVSVIAPGAGTRANGAVYADLGCDGGVCLEIVGQSGSPYDCYPASWPQGSQAPNLESFTHEVLHKGIVEQNDCLIFGSRGGQVVLPCLWHARGAAVPPAIVINGGCAMSLPTNVYWPETAVTFLLLGGRDTFRGGFSTSEYIANARNCVPRENRTTAILYVHEMTHMPQANLLGAAVRPMLAALLAWRASEKPPRADFERLVGAVLRGGWSGQLWYTLGNGAWQDVPFGACKAATDSIRLTGPGFAVARGGGA